MKKVKIAVVGLHRGSLLADFILRYSQNMELVAVSDFDRQLAEDFARKNKIPTVYDSLDDVLKIQKEGRTKRQQAEMEMRRMEADLKNKLLEIQH